MLQAQEQAATIRARNEADNMLSERIIEFELTQARIRMLPEAFKALMEPAGRIESIRVFDTAGFSAGRSGGDGEGRSSGPSDLADQLLRFTGNKPLVDAMLASAGVAGAGGSLKDIVSAATAQRAPGAETTDKTD